MAMMMEITAGGANGSSYFDSGFYVDEKGNRQSQNMSERGGEQNCFDFDLMTERKFIGVDPFFRNAGGDVSGNFMGATGAVAGLAAQNMISFVSIEVNIFVPKDP